MGYSAYQLLRDFFHQLYLDQKMKVTSSAPVGVSGGSIEMMRKIKRSTKERKK